MGIGNRINFMVKAPCYGTYSQPDGKVYLGEWREDKMHGLGMMKTK